MKKLLIFIFFTLLLFSDIFCQHEITIDFKTEISKIKNLLGVNRGPGKRIKGYIEAGVTAVRLHDERASDYYNYSDFWIYDSAADSFTIINPNFNPSNPSFYHWENLDENVRAIAENKMDVFFRIGVSYPDNPAFATPPLKPPLDPDGLNFNNFAELCKHTVMHYNDGWDNGFSFNVKYWEIWNEPGGIFWKGSIVQFYKMFETVFKTLKNYNPDLKVGGPGAVPSTIVVPNDAFFKKFLEYMAEHNVQLDFYSWHIYGAENPYGIKYWAETVRNQLDSLGFTNTENYITEINYYLGDAQKTMENNIKGATYLLSNLITLQESPVEKMFWYPGMALCDLDKDNSPQLYWNAYGFKVFSLILNNTPIQLQTSGSDVIDGNWDKDTTNFMVLAAKSENNNKVYIAISNYNSSYKDYKITINNLPWHGIHQIKLKL